MSGMMGHNSQNQLPPTPELSVEERKEHLKQQITLWVGSLRLDAALSAEELGKYSGMQKALLLRNGLLVGAIRHCRLNPLADTRIPILALITFLADNNDGICSLTITRMCQIFGRSRETIVRSIASLEEDGQIGVNRKGGMPSSYWPLIPAALAELSANPVWFVDALSEKPKPKFRVFGSPQEAIASATEQQSALPDQSGSLDRQQSGRLDHNRSRICGEPVKDLRRTGQGSPDSISLSNSRTTSHERSSDPGGSGAEAPPPNASSIRSVVWRQAVAYLTRAYNGSVPEKDLRSRLGVLVKEYGEGHVIDALGKAEKGEAIDPLDYATGILRQSPVGKAPPARKTYSR
jgi:hypothetical protein